MLESHDERLNRLLLAVCGSEEMADCYCLLAFPITMKEPIILNEVPMVGEPYPTVLRRCVQTCHNHAAKALPTHPIVAYKYISKPLETLACV